MANSMHDPPDRHPCRLQIQPAPAALSTDGVAFVAILSDERGSSGSGVVTPPGPLLERLLEQYRSRPDRLSADQLDHIGAALFSLLLADSGLLPTWRLIQAHAVGRPLHLRVRLDTAADALAALPLELLRDARGFLFSGTGSTISREIAALPAAHAPLPAAPRVLLAWASPDPDRLGRIRASPHVVALRAIFGERLTVLPQASLSGLVEALQQERFDVLHLLAHGHRSQRTGGVILSGKPGGELIDAQRLAGALSGRGLRLVFLSSCKSAVSGGHPFSGVGQKLLAWVGGALQWVVACQANLPVRHSAALAETFYRQLSCSADPSEALAAARAALPIAWSVPVLLGRPQSSQPVRFPTNLTAPDDAFVGRVRERQQLRQWLARPGQLVTLVGEGGLGKSRLSEELGRALLGHFQGGVWVCRLEGAHSEAAVCQVVAQALDIQLSDGGVQLGRALAGRGALLLILDNIEQVVAPLAGLLQAWRRAAPQLRVLATGRRPLGLAAEQRMLLPELSDADAAALFIDRARRRQPRFSAPAGQVEALVGLLGGLPLAVEMAAARAGSFPLPRLRDLVARRLLSLSDRRHGRPLRHRSLQVICTWSWEQLTAAQQHVLAQCCIFRGGFTAAAAEQIIDRGETGEDLWIEEVLEVMVERYLLRLEPTGSRYRLLAVVRAFLEEQLPADVSEALAARHARHFSRLGSAPAPLRAPQLTGICRELDNLTAACQWATAHGEPQLAEALLAAVVEGVELIGPAERGWALAQALLRRWPARARAHLLAGRLALQGGMREAAEHHLRRAAQDPQLKAAALSGLGELRRRAGELTAAAEHYTAALALCPEETVAVEVLLREGMLQGDIGNLSVARDRFSVAEERSRTLGDPRLHARAIQYLGLLAQLEGRLELAIENLQQALQLHRRLHNARGEGVTLGNLAFVLQHQGHLSLARDHYIQAIAGHREQGNHRSLAADLYNLGSLEYEQGHLESALANIRESEEIVSTLQEQRRQAAGPMALGLIHLAMGALDVAEAHLAQAWSRCPAQDIAERGRIEGAIAELELLRGRPAAAVPRLEASLRAALPPWTCGVYRGMLGLCLALEGDLEAGHAQLQRAQAQLTPCQHRIEHARLQARSGQVLALSERRQEAMACLRHAQQVAAALQVTPRSPLAQELATLEIALGVGGVVVEMWG